MAEFNQKKLQVFVSSTFTDLRNERQAAVEAILTAGHIPAGMELFTAGDESQMEVIKQWINESDVYLLILGCRYGSIEPTKGKSYTHLEYEYAFANGKPLFACVMNDPAVDERPQSLKDFRALVLSKMSKLCEDAKDIKIAVGESLSRLARRENLVGWVRPNTQSNLPALTDEMARLSKENAELRQRMKEFEESIREGKFTRPQAPSIEYLTRLAQTNPRNAIQKAWAFMETTVAYALLTNNLDLDPNSNLHPRIGDLIGHGDITLEDGNRVLHEFHDRWTDARNNRDFTASVEETLETTNGLMAFSWQLLARCDALDETTLPGKQSEQRL